MRKRRSEYRELLKEWCSQGIAVKDMTNMLIDMTGGDFYDQGVYAYIYRHGLRYKSPVKNRRICDLCEHCHEYINTNNTTGRICDKSWRTIQPNVSHSPMWCEYEKGH